MFDFSTLKDVWLDVSADVGESSYWSEIASLQTMDNLLANGHLNFVEYLKRVPDEYIPQKQELISTIEEQMQQDALMQESLMQTEFSTGMDPNIPIPDEQVPIA